MAHATWLRLGLADAPDSPFGVLRLQEVSETRLCGWAPG